MGSASGADLYFCAFVFIHFLDRGRSGICHWIQAACTCRNSHSSLSWSDFELFAFYPVQCISKPVT